MVDALSSLAAVAGLADVTCRLGKELYGFFSAIKHASQDIQNMLKELQQLEAIISSIQTLAENYGNSPWATDDNLFVSGIHQTILHCKDEFETLRERVGRLRLDQHSGTAKNLTSKVKWILDDKKTVQSCQKLERIKLSLTTLLTSAGW